MTVGVRFYIPQNLGSLYHAGLDAYNLTGQQGNYQSTDPMLGNDPTLY